MFRSRILPVFLGIVFYMILGAIWFSPKLFGNLYMQSSASMMQEPSVMQLLGAILNGFVLSVVFNEILIRTKVTQWHRALGLGFVLWLGFALTALFPGLVWKTMGLNLFLIVSGYMLLVTWVIALVLVLFRKDA